MALQRYLTRNLPSRTLCASVTVMAPLMVATTPNVRFADQPSQNSDANLARRLSVQYPAVMIRTVAIQGYRSLRDLVLPLGQLSVITGANGSGKSSVYRPLRLLADVAHNAVIGSLLVKAVCPLRSGRGRRQ